MGARIMEGLDFAELRGIGIRRIGLQKESCRIVSTFSLEDLGIDLEIISKFFKALPGRKDITMGLDSISSRSRCQSKSVSLRTNEEFLRLYNDAMEAWVTDFQSPSLTGFSRPRQLDILACACDDMWKLFQERIRDFDRLLKRAEKYAQLSELLRGIMLQFEHELFPTLRSLCHGDCVGPYSFSPLYSLLPLNEFLEVFVESVSSELESAHKVLVSALALLSFVYQYLIGCVDSAKTYSPGSFLFRLIFVAIVLFLGSYVWIKSRQASFTANRRKRKLGDESDVPKGVYQRAVKDSRGSTYYKYEPRFKPLREKTESSTPLNFSHLPLGSYDTPREAVIVRHIAVVLYGEEEGRPVQFEDGICLPFPSVTDQEECPPSGKKKAVWVTRNTKELYAELLKEKARQLQLLHPAVETGSHHVHAGEASRRDPSPSAPGARSTATESTCFPPPHRGYDVVAQATTFESHGLGQEPAITPGVFSVFFSDSDFDQVISSLPQWEGNDFAAVDHLGNVVGDYPETGTVFGCESSSVPPQSSALDIPTSAVFASLPELGGGNQGLEIIEHDLNSATAIPFQQLESLPEQVQLQVRVPCQEQCPEEFGGSSVELQQKLLESEKENSELREKLRQSKQKRRQSKQKLRRQCKQKLRSSEKENSELREKLGQSEVENEKWRSMCRQGRSVFSQLAKLMSASDEDGSPVDIQ